MGGAGVYGAYEQRGACYAACYIKNWPLLQRISPALRDVDFATSDLPSLAAARDEYEHELRRLAHVLVLSDPFYYPFYRHPQSALDVTRLPTAQFFVFHQQVSIYLNCEFRTRIHSHQGRGWVSRGPQKSKAVLYTMNLDFVFGFHTEQPENTTLSAERQTFSHHPQTLCSTGRVGRCRCAWCVCVCVGGGGVGVSACGARRHHA